jgi:hypothetical protein
MDKNTTKQFKSQIRERSFANAKSLFDFKGERMKTFFQMALWVLLLGFVGGATYFGLIGNDTASSFLIGLFITDLLTIIGVRIYIPILAYLQMWDVAAERDEERQKDLEAKQREVKEQKDLVESFRQRERMGRAELIELKETREDVWVGIEIINREKDNPFNASLYIKEVTNHSIKNLIEVMGETRGTLHILPNNGMVTTKIAFLHTSENAVYVYPTNSGIKFTESGEYYVSTTLEGGFYHGSYETAYKENKWKIIFSRENRFLDMRKVE